MATRGNRAKHRETSGWVKIAIAISLAFSVLGWFLPNRYFLPWLNSGTCVSGTNGTNGKDGTTGYNGSNGTNGTNGKDGANGTNGTNGKDGATGATGATGQCGPAGSDGSTGAQGPQGIQGIQGIQGEQGIQGLTGNTGPQGERGPQGIQGIQGLPGTDGRDGVNGLGYYGSFYDTTTQANLHPTNTMTFNTTDSSATNGISIVDGSKITFAHAGVYNIAFSAQIDKTDSGWDQAAIWLSKNGTNAAWSATKVDANNNNAKVVAAWNFFVTVSVNDYYEFKWSSDDSALRLYAQAANSIPAIPSIILTVNQVG